MDACDRFLDVGLTYLGSIPFDEALRKAVQRQLAVIQAYPRSRSAPALQKVADKIDELHGKAPNGRVEFFFERLVRANRSEQLVTRL